MSNTYVLPYQARRSPIGRLVLRLGLWLRNTASSPAIASEAERDGEAAFLNRAGEMLDLYGNSLLRMAYSYLHSMSDAEDVLQETLIRSLRARPLFDGEKHEKAWLMRVAINLSKDRLAYNRYRSHDELDERIPAEDRPDLSFVWEAVKQLPAQQAEVIHLFYEEGYSCADIAELLDKNEATVRSLMHRARGRLKELLKEAYDFEIS